MTKKEQLWFAIHKYVIACGGRPDKNVYGNRLRQEAVVEIERLALEREYSKDD